MVGKMEVKPGAQRHLLFASRNQLALLKNAKRWYMDGSFIILSSPLYQLYSLHEFVRKGEQITPGTLSIHLHVEEKNRRHFEVFNF